MARQTSALQSAPDTSRPRHSAAASATPRHDELIAGHIAVVTASRWSCLNAAEAVRHWRCASRCAASWADHSETRAGRSAFNRSMRRS